MGSIFRDSGGGGEGDNILFSYKEHPHDGYRDPRHGGRIGDVLITQPQSTPLYRADPKWDSRYAENLFRSFGLAYRLKFPQRRSGKLARADHLSGLRPSGVSLRRGQMGSYESACPACWIVQIGLQMVAYSSNRLVRLRPMGASGAHGGPCQMGNSTRGKRIRLRVVGSQSLLHDRSERRADLRLRRALTFAYARVYTCIQRMAERRPTRRTSKRNGRPLVVYFSQEQAEGLDSLSRQRRVAKADLVRFAVDRLLNQINSGQLELPLGI